MRMIANRILMVINDSGHTMAVAITIISLISMSDRKIAPIVIMIMDIKFRMLCWIMHDHL